MTNIFIYISLIWFSASPQRVEMKQIQSLFFPDSDENRTMTQKRVRNMALNTEVHQCQATSRAVNHFEKHYGQQAVVERQKKGVHLQWSRGSWQSYPDSQESGFME